MNSLFSICLLLLCLCLSNCFGQTCEESKKNKFPKVKLMKQLLCNYQKNIRPVKDEETTINASFTVAIYRIDFDEKDSEFNLQTYIKWDWDDEFLVWDINEFTNIYWVLFNSFQIWTPSVFLQTHWSMTFWTDIIGSTRCRVNYKGHVICILSDTYKSLCVVDSYLWPYDEYTCTLKIGSNFYTEKQVNLTVDEDELLILKREQHGVEWKLKDVKIAREMNTILNKTFPWARIDITVERESFTFAYSIIVPAFVISILSLISLWVDPSNGTRILFCCSSIICHIIFLVFLGTIIPNNAQRCPRIVLFFKDSLFLSILIFATTIISSNMDSIWSRQPRLFASSIGWLLSSRPGQILFLSTLDPKQAAEMEVTSTEEDSSSLVTNNISPSSTSSSSRQSKLASSILDRIMFYIFTIIYIIYIFYFWL